MQSATSFTVIASVGIAAVAAMHPGRGTLRLRQAARRQEVDLGVVGEPLPRAAVEAIVRRPCEAIALGGTAFEADIVKASHYQFSGPGASWP